MLNKSAKKALPAIQTCSCTGDKRVLPVPANETGNNGPCRTHKTECAYRAVWLVFRRRVCSVWTICNAATGHTDKCQACTPGLLSWTSGVVLTCWLLVIRIRQALKLSTDFSESSCQRVRWFWSCYRGTDRRRRVSRCITATFRF